MSGVAWMKNTALSIIGRRWRELVGFARLFRVLGSLYFAPVAALAGMSLLGRAVLDSTALVSCLLSPRGLLAITVAAVTALGTRLIECAGPRSVLHPRRQAPAGDVLPSLDPRLHFR